jgi:L-ascorbate metabolism protein UlaG (beta-lactamase superfamily)
MMQLQDIDIAFLPVNQPYTMTVDQTAEAVRAIHPTIFYPYHYGQVEEQTDINRLVELVKDITDIRIRPME